MDRKERTKVAHERLFRSGPVANAAHQDFVDILLETTFGEVFSIGELPDKTRELISVTLLTTQQVFDALETHLHAALNVGAPAFAVREAIYQTSLFIGFPKTLQAIKVMDKVFADRGISLTEQQGTLSEEERLAKGVSLAQELHGNLYAEHYQNLPEPFATALPQLICGWRYGDMYQRSGLDIKTRELLALCSAISVDVGKQLGIYVEGAKKSGNSTETILAALVHCIPYVGLPIATNAIHKLLKLETRR